MSITAHPVRLELLLLTVPAGGWAALCSRHYDFTVGIRADTLHPRKKSLFKAPLVSLSLHGSSWNGVPVIVAVLFFAIMLVVAVIFASSVAPRAGVGHRFARLL